MFLDTASLFQIHIDIPRTNPLIPLFQQPLVQEVREAPNVLGSYLRGTCSVWTRASALPPPRAGSRLTGIVPDTEFGPFRALSGAFSFDPLTNLTAE